MKTSKTLPLDPLAEVPVAPSVAALPEADIHLPQEWSPCLDRVLARRAARSAPEPAVDWRRWASDLMDHTPPDMPRLEQLAKTFPAALAADANSENAIARLEDLPVEGAADGAILVEMRFGGATALLQPEFIVLLCEAERRARERHPALHAEALYTVLMWDEPDHLERVVVACIRAARIGLSGIALLCKPYDAEAEWHPLYRVAEQAAAAALGISAHAGEFTTVNIAVALHTPGLTRLGHAVNAARDPRLLGLIAQSGVAIECTLKCNVVLGAVPSYLRGASNPAVCECWDSSRSLHRQPCATRHGDRARICTGPHPRVLARRAAGLHRQRHPSELRLARAQKCPEGQAE